MNIILADDHIIFRDGLKLLLLSEGHIIINEVANAPDLKAAVINEEPDLVVTDFRMPGNDSMSIVDYLKKRYDDLKLIVMTGVTSATLFKQLTDSRADGVLTKSSSADDLLTAIHTVFSGKRFIDPIILAKMVECEVDLTAREYQVLELIFSGNKNSDISDRLNISIKTVDKHRVSLMKKLGVNNVVDLVHTAAERDLL